MRNMWGTDPAWINADEFCPFCERVVPWHYGGCPTRQVDRVPAEEYVTMSVDEIVCLRCRAHGAPDRCWNCGRDKREVGR